MSPSSSSRPKRSSRRCASRSRMSNSGRPSTGSPLDPARGDPELVEGPGRPERVTERGLLFIVSAPSGAGKTTLVERLVEQMPHLKMSRSYTSRPSREGETDGVDYNFVSRERFEQMVAVGEVLEWADGFGNLYGTSAADTERGLGSGTDLRLRLG